MMDIKERLEDLKRWELNNLASQLKVKKYYKQRKQPLINHIVENYTEQEIKAFIGVKLPFRKRIKDYTHVYGIITAFGLFFGIIAIILAVVFQQSSKKSDTLQDERLGTISEKLERYDPLKRDKLITQLKEKLKELEKALKDEKIGYPKERKEALEALQKKDYSKAQRLFEKIRKKEREKEIGHARTAYNLGNAYFVDLKFEKALDAYLEAEKLDSVNTTYLNSIGRTYYELANYQKAFAYFKKALAIDLKTYGDSHLTVAIGWNKLGNTLNSLGEFKRAIGYYDEALNILENTFDSQHPHTKIVKKNLAFIKKKMNISR